jgi:hypothetical protein
MDNWQHRSEKMRCISCMWFVEKKKCYNSPAPETSTKEAISQGSIGRCRRHAPSMNGFPVVFQSDWCGDHKLNENV